MKISEAIAQHILELYFGNNWTDVNVRETLQDVTLKEALTKTKASPNTIASLVQHITFYNKIILERLHGSNPQIDEINGYNLPPLENEAAWELLKENNLQSAQELADEARLIADDTLQEPVVEDGSSRYKSLHGVTEHGYYHLGQIVILKKLIRAAN
jgi:uncharacterized damage-inducible protein DinB